MRPGQYHRSTARGPETKVFLRFDRGDIRVRSSRLRGPLPGVRRSIAIEKTTQACEVATGKRQ